MTAASKLSSVLTSLARRSSGAPTCSSHGEAAVLREETSDAHHRDRRGKGPGIGQRFVEVSLGRCYAQPGLTATGEDPLPEAVQPQAVGGR